MKKLHSLGQIGRLFGCGETLTGPNALAGLRRLGGNRVSVVISSSVLAAQRLYLEKCLARVSADIIAAPRGEPLLSNACEIASQLKAFSPDSLVAIGGGSIIDLAKLAWVIFEKPEITFDTRRQVYPVSHLRTKCSAFIAVPTTYGSGSENSSATVFQKQEQGKKHFLVGSELLPDIAILDPQMALGLPEKTAVFGVLDALTHAIEGYVSKGSNSATKQLSGTVIRTIRHYLSMQSITHLLADANAVTELMLSASFAGIVQNIATPGLAHSLSHYCAMYGVHHGQGCGYFLPLSIRYNADDANVLERYQTLAQISGFTDYTAMLTWLDQLHKDYHLSQGMPAIQQLKSTIEPELFYADPTVSTNPVPIILDRVFAMLEQHNSV
ncbi:MAG: iron-containing alcohol dehydrogenase [Pseudomonadota bacterium]